MHNQATVLAVGTQVIVCALHTSEAMACFNLHVAVVASAGEGRSIWVVQVVQHHGTAVLGSPDGVKLVVVALTKRQERLQIHRGCQEPAGTDQLRWARCLHWQN